MVYTENDFRTGSNSSELASIFLSIDSEYIDRLTEHFRRSKHHPQYYREIPLEQRMELTCDMLGSVKYIGTLNNKNLSLGECRAYIEFKRWEDWRFAVIDHLPAPSQRVPYLNEKLNHKWYDTMELVALHDEKSSINELSCVKDWVNILLGQNIAVYQVWREIFKRYDSGFGRIKEAIQNHDLDKFRPDMIRAFTKKFCNFNRPFFTPLDSPFEPTSPATDSYSPPLPPRPKSPEDFRFTYSQLPPHLRRIYRFPESTRPQPETTGTQSPPPEPELTKPQSPPPEPTKPQSPPPEPEPTKPQSPPPEAEPTKPQSKPQWTVSHDAIKW